MQFAKRDRFLIMVSIGLGVLLMFTFFRFIWMDQWIQNRVQSITKSAPTITYTSEVTVIVDNLESAYWQSIRKGILEAAKLYKIAVQFVELEKIANSSLENQMDFFISARTGAILVQGSNSEAFFQRLKRARQEAVPVVLLDSEINTPNRLSYVGFDQYLTGKKLAKYIMKNHQNIQVGLLYHSGKDANELARVRGMRESFSQTKQNVKIVANEETDHSVWNAELVAEKILKNHPSINVMVGLGEMDAIGILNAVKKSGRQGIHIYSFDNHPKTLEAMRKKEILGTMKLVPYQTGFDAIRVVANYLASQKIEDPNYLDIDVLTPGQVMNQEVIGP